MSIFDNVAAGLQAQRGKCKKADLDGIVEQLAARRRPLGRGQGPSRQARHGPLRRSAAAALHRPHDRRRARGHPDGRAVLGARPDRDADDRGADGRAQGALHDRDRHAQHAAGGARADTTAFFNLEEGARRARRVRRDREDLHEPRRTSAPRSTSPGSSGRGAPCRSRPRSQFAEELARLEEQALGGLDLVVHDARPDARGARAPGRRARRDGRSPTTTGSTAATSRCTRRSCRCSRCRRRWRATCASSPRCCT